jgi:hypothetical protein
VFIVSCLSYSRLIGRLIAGLGSRNPGSWVVVHQTKPPGKVRARNWRANLPRTHSYEPAHCAPLSSVVVFRRVPQCPTVHVLLRHGRENWSIQRDIPGVEFQVRPFRFAICRDSS